MGPSSRVGTKQDKAYIPLGGADAIFLFTVVETIGDAVVACSLGVALGTHETTRTCNGQQIRTQGAPFIDFCLLVAK